MIILVTGVPGAGKTSFAVSELLRSEKRKLTYGCPVKGIEELENPEFENLKNCCILVDEAHTIMGTGMQGLVNFLTVHRHNNLDFVLTTQDFSLLNRKILPLVGRHYHLSLTPLGERRMLTWDRYGNPRSKTDISAATTKMVSVDRTNWDKFDSVTNGAEMPEVRKSKKPKIYFVVFFLLIVLLGSLMYFGSFSPVASYYHKVEIPEVSADVKQEAQEEKQEFRSENFNLPQLSSPLPQPFPEKPFPERSEDDEIVGCVKSEKTCNCYNSKAQKVSVSSDYCSQRF